MLYVDLSKQNLQPDVREHLWLRASGASQLLKTYDDYVIDPDDLEAKTIDYYTALKEAPTVPNPSIKLINTTLKDIDFDLEITGSRNSFIDSLKDLLTQKLMRKKLERVLQTY